MGTAETRLFRERKVKATTKLIYYDNTNPADLCYRKYAFSLDLIYYNKPHKTNYYHSSETRPLTLPTKHREVAGGITLRPIISLLSFVG